MLLLLLIGRGLDSIDPPLNTNETSVSFVSSVFKAKSLCLCVSAFESRGTEIQSISISWTREAGTEAHEKTNNITSVAVVAVLQF